MPRTRRSVLLAAGGAPWEAAALHALEGDGVVVLKRCVDLHDLLASGAAGQAEVAVVAADLPGLDADAVTRLLRHDVRTLALGDDAESERMARIGVVVTADPDDPASLADAVERAAGALLVTDPEPEPPVTEPLPEREHRGRVVAVWGPAGAPGRTTVAVALAAEHAVAGGTSVLVDADPYGGAVAQHLGVLDEMSGLLAAARLVNDGSLDAASYASVRRRVAERFDVLTGLPRPDRWIEARSAAVERVLELSAEVGDVVVDCGFSIEEELDPGRSLGRNAMTLAALGSADVVVLVGSAEPTGLTRMARALVDLAEVAPAVPTHVVVNRMRDSLGWQRSDIAGMVEGYARGAPVHFLPEDRATLDKALVAGKAPAELGDSPFRRGVQALVGAVFQAAPNSR